MVCVVLVALNVVHVAALAFLLGITPSNMCYRSLSKDLDLVAMQAKFASVLARYQGALSAQTTAASCSLHPDKM